MTRGGIIVPPLTRFWYVQKQTYSTITSYWKKIFTFSGKESTFYELDDVRHVAKKDPSDKNISMSEAMTQTDWQMFDRMGGFSDDLAANPPGPGQGTGKYKTLLSFKPGPMPSFLTAMLAGAVLQSTLLADFQV